MHIVVCIKQIIDPEVPPHLFKIDPVKKVQIRGTHALVISTFDEVALEVALQLKEKADGRVTVLTIGGEEAKEALRMAIAMGADDAILLNDLAFEGADSLGKARILAAAIRKLGDFDGVLCGRQAGDVELGLVGPFLAEELALPFIGVVANIEPAGSKVRLKRPVENGYEYLESPVPFLATITNDESNIPRYASIRRLRMARRQEIPVWSAADIGIDPALVGPQAVILEMEELFVPKREIRCEIIQGETGEEKARNLAEWLKELKLI